MDESVVSPPFLPMEEEESAVVDSIMPPPGFSFEHEGELRVLTPEDESWLVDYVVKRFDKFDTQKSALKKRWKRVEQAITGVTSSITKERFYGLVPFGKQSVQTLVSHFWSRSLQSDEVFFDVMGEDEDSQELASMHKIQLLRHFKKDRARQKMDEMLVLHGLLETAPPAHQARVFRLFAVRFATRFSQGNNTRYRSQSLQKTRLGATPPCRTHRRPQHTSTVVLHRRKARNAL